MLHFDLSKEHLQIIAECLANGPYKIVSPVLAEMQRQINAQEAAAKAAAEVKEAA